jgi:hypothetical protein
MKSILKDQLSTISRREFLRLSGTSLLSLFMLPALGCQNSGYSIAQPVDENIGGNLGRVCSTGVGLYEYPSYTSQYIETLRRDTVLAITGVVSGDSEPPHNRIWYELDGQGYAHSGSIQPVAELQNPPLSTLPGDGCLAEVTVPFTAAHWSADPMSGIPYKLYFGSTYWVDKVKEGPGGVLWYRIRDKEDFTFYAEASHLHIITEPEMTPLSNDLPLEEKRLEVHLQEQVIIAYEQENPVYMARIATGARFQTGNFETPTGQFISNRKRPSRHMMDPNGSSYDLPGVPWVCYLTERGVALHGTYWHNDFGKPRSHGCINLTNEAARWFYRWTQPVVSLSEKYLAEMNGTRVDVM